MTCSTLHDVTRIAALPGSPGAGAAQRLEAPQAPLPPEPTTKPRKPKKKAAKPDPDAVEKRARAALDSAQNHLAERPGLITRLADVFGIKMLNDRDVVKMEMPAEVAPRILCDGEDVMTIDGIKYQFHPDGGTTMFEGTLLETGKWLPVGTHPEKILGKRATLLAFDELINGRRQP